MRAPCDLSPSIAARFDAGLVQGAGQCVGAVLGTRKNQHLMPAARGEQVAEQLLLAFAVGLDHLLGDGFSRRVARRNVDRHRVVQQTAGQFANFRRESSREHQVLALFGQQRDDLADVADEAHVEHAISFIENENLDTGQIDRTLLDVVEQAPRRSDQNIDAAAQVGDLRIDADTAKYSQ